MKYASLPILLLIAGCNTIPAKPEWPAAPDVSECPELAVAPTTEKLSELLSVVTANYGKYHECTARVQAWQSWYKEQKKIYEESK